MSKEDKTRYNKTRPEKTQQDMERKDGTKHNQKRCDKLGHYKNMTQHGSTIREDTGWGDQIRHNITHITWHGQQKQHNNMWDGRTSQDHRFQSQHHVGVKLYKHLQQPLLIPVVPITHIQCHQERWRGDKDELKTPQTDVGDGKELIVADIFTARLKNRDTDIYFQVTYVSVWTNVVA